MKIMNAVLSTLVLVTFVSCGVGKSSTTMDIAGEIQYFEGNVTVNGIQAEIGLEVMDGDVILTGPDSFVELKFGEYRVLNAEENSRLVLDAADKTFKLDIGAIAVLQSKARWFSRRKPWLVQTPTMVAAVRGTVYYTKVESPESVYFCLCNGKIHLEDADAGGVLNLEAAHHNAVRFIRTDDGVVYQNAPMLYHTDEVIESLADTVYVPIDWTQIPD
jgi:hypothetical protein